MAELSRRDFLKGAAAGVVSACVPKASPGDAPAPGGPFGDRVAKIFWTLTPADDPAEYARWLDEAAALGFDAASIVVPWTDRVRSGDFGAHRDFAEHAIAKGMKISVWPWTVCHEPLIGGLYDMTDVMLDHMGRPIRKLFETSISFSSPNVGRATDYVAQVAEAFRDYHNDGHLLYVAPSNTGYAEVSFEHGYGGWGEDGWRDAGCPVAASDYNPHATFEFRRWLETERYGAEADPLAALNAAWGTRCSAFDEAAPPLPTSDDAPHTVFQQGRRSLDWYAFRHRKLRSFIRECCEKIEAIGGWKTPPVIVNNAGSYYDNQVGQRCTASPEDLMCHPWLTGIKDNPTLDYDIEFDASLLVSAAARRGGVSVIEITEDIDRPDNVQVFVRNVRTAIDRGVNGISFAFFIPLWRDGRLTRQHAALVEVVEAMKRDGCWDMPLQRPAPRGEFTYAESEILAKGGYDRGEDCILSRFRRAREEAGGPVGVAVARDVTV